MFRHASRLIVTILILTATFSLDSRLLAQAGRQGGAAAASAATGADNLIGSWVMDRSKSTFTGAVPVRRSTQFEKTPMGIRHTVETMQGEVVYKLQYVFNVDGKDYPADVQMQFNTLSFKRIDANTLERTGKYQGTVLETVTYQLSADGKTLTATQMTMQNGDTPASIQVFTKQ